MWVVRLPPSNLPLSLFWWQRICCSQKRWANDIFMQAVWSEFELANQIGGNVMSPSNERTIFWLGVSFSACRLIVEHLYIALWIFSVISENYHANLNLVYLDVCYKFTNLDLLPCVNIAAPGKHDRFGCSNRDSLSCLYCAECENNGGKEAKLFVNYSLEIW